MLGADGKEYPDKYVLYCKSCGKPACYHLDIREFGYSCEPMFMLDIECSCKKPRNKVVYELIRETAHVKHDFEFRKRS